MKKTILLTGFLMMGIVHLINGQTDVDEEEMVGFACSFSGMPSKPVIKVEELLRKENYLQISKLLSSRNPAEQYLAVVVLEKLKRSDRYQISDSEWKLILEIKNSRQPVSVCSGCTYWNVVSLRDLFSSPEQIHADFWIEEIMDDKR